MRQIKSLDELKQMCEGLTMDFFIQLNFARSSKQISYNSGQDKFYILNEIDGTRQKLNSKHIMDRRYTNIGYAITQGSLYSYED
jgi:hypothetical protein